MKVYIVQVQLDGQWAAYQVATTYAIAETIRQRLSWPTRIVKGMR